MGNEESRLEQVEPEGLKGEANKAGSLACLSGGASNAPKLSRSYDGYFKLFDRNRDGLLAFEEVQMLAEAICSLWQVQMPEPQALQHMFQRHSYPAAPGLTLEQFSAFADECMAVMLDRYPDLTIPGTDAVSAYMRGRSDVCMLHMSLPTANQSLRSMGSTGVCVKLLHITGFEALRGEEQFCCVVQLRRHGLLLPRQVRRVARPTHSDAAGWHFDDDFIFDEPALLGRPGNVEVSLAVRRTPRGLCAMSQLATARRVPVPTPGEVSLDLVDRRGVVLGEAKLRAGWCCSEALMEFTGESLRLQVQAGSFSHARDLLQVSSAAAATSVAGIPDAYGRNVLMLAAAHPQGIALVKDLLAFDNEALWRATDASGATVAHYAAMGGSLETLAAVLGSGIAWDTPAPGLNGATPLMLAALRCSPDHIRLLIGNGANVAAVDASGLASLGWAVGTSGLLDHGRSKWICRCLSVSETTLRNMVKAWDEFRCETVMALMAELWRVNPPVSTREANLEEEELEASFTPALVQRWLRIAEQAAEQGTMTASPTNLFRWMFHEQMLQLCGDLDLYRRLIGAIFEAALKERSETLAVRLVQDLNVSFNFSTSSSSSTRQGSTDAEHCNKQHLLEDLWGRSSLGLAVELRMPKLAYVLLNDTSGPLGYMPVGSPSNATRIFRLAVDMGSDDLAEALLQRVPQDMVRDTWQEPAVLAATSLMECPVCLLPLHEQPGALYVDSGPYGTVLACSHLVCRRCADKISETSAAAQDRLQSRCPLCRAIFTAFSPMPDVRKDPMAWFAFAGSGAGDSKPAAGVRQPNRHCLTRDDVERVLPATLPLDPQQLHDAISMSLWEEWDVDGDGLINCEDFLSADSGLLRWLLVHLHEHSRHSGSSSSLDQPEVVADKRSQKGWVKWFANCAGVAPEVQRPSSTFAGRIQLSRGDALCAVLRLAGVSALNAALVDEYREWLMEHWASWADGGFDIEVADSQSEAAANPEGAQSSSSRWGAVPFATFVQPGGLGEALLHKAATSRTERSIDQLASSVSKPSGQAEALIGLCRLVPSMATFGPRRSSIARGALASDNVEIAEQDLLLYRKALWQVLQTLQTHAKQLQVVGWACRALVLLVIGPGGVPTSPAEEVDWQQVIRALLDDELPDRFRERAGEECATLVVPTITNAIAHLCAATRACSDPRNFREVVAMAALLLRALVGSGTAEALQSTLAAVEGYPSTPATRAYSALIACTMMCDLRDIMRQWERCGCLSVPLWAAARALSPTSVQVGQRVEVCCNGGWKVGTVSRAPAQGASSSPRDECWVVSCGSPDAGVVYSRHVWAPGWREEVAALQVEYQQLLYSLALGPRKAPSAAPSMRRALLSSIVARGLGPKAKAEPPSPSGVVIRAGTNSSISVRTGDIVWLSVTVERARQLQTQRHGDWSEQMAFCLDCPGRVIETITGPPRLRISHGCFGVFLWNPAVVTRAVSSCEQLPFEEQHGPVVVGDEVLLCPEQHKAVPLQIGHGGWSTRMAMCLGRYGRVLGINTRGDIRIDTPGIGSFIWNPATIEAPDSGSPLALCAHAIACLDDEGAAIQLLPVLTELVKKDNSDCAAAVQDVLAALHSAGEPHSVLPALRAYGALLLLAVSLELKRDAIGGEADRPQRKYMPACASATAIAALEASPAMEWSASEMGGVAFKDVVAGKVDVMHAASRWILAFFATRHRRLCAAPGFANHREQRGFRDTS